MTNVMTDRRNEHCRDEMYPGTPYGPGETVAVATATAIWTHSVGGLRRRDVEPVKATKGPRRLGRPTLHVVPRRVA